MQNSLTRYGQQFDHKGKRRTPCVAARSPQMFLHQLKDGGKNLENVY